jgi:hypothetical protein
MDQPGITAPNAACLDFGVAKEGYLTAYRWSGERELTEGSLVFGSVMESSSDGRCGCAR